MDNVVVPSGRRPTFYARANCLIFTCNSKGQAKVTLFIDPMICGCLENQVVKARLPGAFNPKLRSATASQRDFYFGASKDQPLNLVLADGGITDNTGMRLAAFLAKVLPCSTMPNFN